MPHDTGAKLAKPPLKDNLSYLEKGLEAMPIMSYTLKKWTPGWIPEEVKTIVTGVAGIHYDPADFDTYDVLYKDSSDPWVFGYHRNSGITIDSIASQFGRLPIQMRQWIRHVITVPAENGWAFEWNGSITFIRPVDDMVSVVVHETGHSLDLNGAYADHPMSASDTWWDKYDQDSNVPDPYAQSNAVEDVAQNTVLAVFNENVEGGYGSIEPEWRKVFNQYATLITAAKAAGQGPNLFQQGITGTATHRLPSSKPVPVSGDQPTTMMLAAVPDVTIKSDVEQVDTSHRADNPHSGCGIKW